MEILYYGCESCMDHYVPVVWGFQPFGPFFGWTLIFVVAFEGYPDYQDWTGGF